jgi:hypothetical protein
MFNKTILSKMYVSIYCFYNSTSLVSGISRKRLIYGPMLTETFLVILVCSFHP